MAYDPILAEKIRQYLARCTSLEIEEKKMFGGLGFMVAGKLCISTRADHILCRFAPERTKEVSARKGYSEVVMGKRHYKGYCYVSREGFAKEDDFIYWLELCLEYNPLARSPKNSN